MKQLELALVPTPGAKPEFLAAVIPIPKVKVVDGDNDHDDGTAAQKAIISRLWQSITEHNPSIVLEGYTRDAWAKQADDKNELPRGGGAKHWQSLHVWSVDGKNKLPGFIKYLMDRQKTAYGRFLAAIHGEGTPVVTTFVWVVLPPQQPFDKSTSSSLSCQVAPLSIISNCPLRPKSGDMHVQQQKRSTSTVIPKTIMTTTTATTSIHSATASQLPKRKGFGLLGNLVGAQKRTNQHVAVSSASSRRKASSSSGSNNTTSSMTHTTTIDNPTAYSSDTGTTIFGGVERIVNSNNTDLSTTTQPPMEEEEEKKSSGRILTDFRNEMEQRMLDFDIDPDVCMKVSIRLSDYTKHVQEADQGKVTMEVLKYIVYEQAEEVNEEWIAHKEPSEFMDEITIAIYKNAEDAPAEVLEELNRAELPEEMIAQQKMIAEQRRQQELKALKDHEQQQREALKRENIYADDLAALNTQKRDRRTIEEIQRDNAKRQKL